MDPTVPQPPPSSSSSSSGARILKLHLCRAGAGAEEEAVWVRVRGEGWVDLGLVGRAVGMDPATLRLNGYFLSRGSDHHVSSCVTWVSLLSFFAARALPSGASPADPIAVLGKTLPASASASASPSPSPSFSGLSDVRDRSSFERKTGLEDGSPCKKSRTIVSYSAVPNVGDGQPSSSSDDDDILGIKRRLCLDDNRNPMKKPKTAELCSSGSAREAAKVPAVAGKTLFSYSCVNEHGKKRPREEEEMVSSISCKRIR